MDVSLHLSASAGDGLATYLNRPLEFDIESAAGFLHQLCCCDALTDIDHYPDMWCCLLQGINSTPARWTGHSNMHKDQQQQQQATVHNVRDCIGNLHDRRYVQMCCGSRLEASLQACSLVY
jgi:hypothetical protein